MPDQTRSIDLTIDIDASPADVWRAISESEQVQNWLAPEVRITPEEWFVSWGGGMEWTEKIDVWEPGRHIRTVSEHERGGVTYRQAVDYFIEAGEGGTVRLRLVHSGFGATAEWDNEIDATTAGWRIFLENLRASLRFGSERPCRSVMRSVMTKRPAVDVWQELTGGLANGASTYRLRLAGVEAEGAVETCRPPNMLTGSYDAVRDARLALMVEGKKAAAVTFLIQTFGIRPAEYDGERARWLAAIEAWEERQGPK